LNFKTNLIKNAGHRWMGTLNVKHFTNKF
jgi:hypothetical protein